jgi:hypothetical protein
MRHTALALAFITLPLLAAIPPRKAEDLQRDATHIITAKVKAVYSTDETRDKPDFVDRHYCIEVVVTKIEKGEGLGVSKVAYLKCWQPEKRPFGWAGPQGQNHLPKVGDEGRYYLAEGDDGSLTILTPNGYEPPK